MLTERKIVYTFANYTLLDIYNYFYILITILAGGTGSVKIVRGFASNKHTDLKIISNVGDNIWLYGLYICPDIDTVLYGLAGMLANQGWGIKDDSFSFLNQMEKLEQETWFKIGDKDLATHILRTNMLRNGRTLSEITDWMRKKYLISAKIFPVTDNQLETNIITDQGEMHIQEFWVKYAGHPRVTNVRYKGAEYATVNPDVIETIKYSDLIVIAPANPVSSINPILAVKGIKDQLMKHKERVVAISPLIGQRAISGPAVKYMRALKLMNSPLGVARFYSDFIGTLLIHSTDTALLSKIESFGVKVYATDIIMANFEDEIRLSSYIKRLQI